MLHLNLKSTRTRPLAARHGADQEDSVGLCQRAGPWAAAIVVLTSCSAPTQPPVPTNLSLSSTALAFAALGETQQLRAFVTDQAGGDMPGAVVSWTSSSSEVATVSSAGLVTAVKNGMASVVATAGGVSATAAVVVEQVAASTVVVPSTITLSALGATAQAGATVHDGQGNPVANAQIRWNSLDETIALVSSAGIVTARTNGTTTIVAGVGTTTGAATVFVQQVTATVELTPTSVSMDVGDTIQLHATARDPGGAEVTNRPVVWASSDTAVARVNTGGAVTGVSPGRTAISATSGEQKASSVITVLRGFGIEEFVLIQAGSFQMGTDMGAENEKPRHWVEITKPFYLQRTEVTQGQWKAVMGSNPSHLPECGDECPVDQVSWNDIQDFLSRLNQQHPGVTYRLPTEAEWEYAARAGTAGQYGGTGILRDMGWFWENSAINGVRQPHRVAQKLPNAWGLFDMHGNVREWVHDWYDAAYYGVSPGTDPTGPTSGTERVLRGGAWFFNEYMARSATRDLARVPELREYTSGFRLAMVR